MARGIQEQMTGQLDLRDRGVKERSGLAVFRNTAMPAVLVEPAFITNPEEEKLIADCLWIHKLARAIIDGARNYFKE